MSTISASKLLSVANENFVASYRKLVEHSPEGEVNQVGGVFAFVTGFPFALFNGCVVVERAAPPELEEALAWVTAHGVPHRVWLAEQAAQKLEAVPTAYGLGRDPASFPGMVLHPVPEPPPPAVGDGGVSRRTGSRLASPRRGRKRACSGAGEPDVSTVARH